MQEQKRPGSPSRLRSSGIVFPDVSAFLAKTKGAAEQAKAGLWRTVCFTQEIPVAVEQKPSVYMDWGQGQYTVYEQKTEGSICICGSEGCGIGPFIKKTERR